ncbi:M23 family metallopeptidase, partial [Candidatus Dependentiae bacterium]|nr:M23 family metallopeptidase [Candidatus Dependentiae bacterium]
MKIFRKITFLIAIQLALFISVYSLQKWPFEPQNSPPPISITFGDYNNKQFHLGVDIPKNKNTPIKSVKSGYVLCFLPDPGGDMGTIIIGDETHKSGCREGFKYDHIMKTPPDLRKLDAKVDEGEIIGLVADFDPGGALDSFDHLHFAYDINGVKWRNPFSFYDSGFLPAQNVIINSENIYFMPDKAWNLHHYQAISGKKIIYGNVDIVVEAHTEINSDIRSGIYSLKYEISNPPPNSSIVPEKTLVKFDELISKDDKYKLIYSETPSDFFHGHYIVTNCGTNEPTSTDPLINVIENAWFTKVRSEVDDSNGGIQSSQNAKINTNAKYKDGEYTIEIEGEAYRNITMQQTKKVIVDNFRPYVEKVLIREINNEKILYERNWEFDGQYLNSETPTIDWGLKNGKYLIEILFSEPVSDAKLELEEYGLIDLTSKESTNEKIKWEGKVTINLDDSCYDEKMEISAIDLAGNLNLRISSDDHKITPTDNLVRDSVGIMQGTGGIDELHKFKVDTIPPTIEEDEKRFPVSKIKGEHSKKFTINDSEIGSGIYDPDKENDTIRMLSSFVNGAFIYLEENVDPSFPLNSLEKVDFIPGIKLINEESTFPYKVTLEVPCTNNNEELKDKVCALKGNPKRYYFYTYATDLAGNKTEQHPYYNDPTRSLRNTLFEKAISKSSGGASGYFYDPSGGS